MRHLIATLPVVMLLAACGEVTSTTASDPRDDGPAMLTTRYPMTVLDDGDGAVLCLGAVAESLPPQCGGPKLIGWDWSAYRGHFESVAGVRWAEFVVTGEYDGTDFTVAEATPASEWDGEGMADDFDLSTPCPEPDGGWQVLDPALTTQRSLDRTMRLASRLDDHAGSWVDQSINPAYDDPDPKVQESQMNDPTKLVVNMLVTGDPAVAEAKLRAEWGGALCVTQAEYTERELRRIQRDLSDVPGFLSSSDDVTRNRVVLAVVHDDGTLQQRLDEKYGEGVVHVDSALVPVE